MGACIVLEKEQYLYSHSHGEQPVPVCAREGTVPV